ncbi:MAG TPA: TonB-dependent receptor [Steroidobacter sp.]|uniref:TonB-dependent receptor n=1 Tax=Steroidobacter sp. TaxID=1978227 RepID=UPI002EDADB09
MRSSHSLRLALAAMLLSHSAFAQQSKTEPRPEEVVVTSTALRENPLEVAQPTTVVAGDELRRQIAASIGETLSSELGVSSTYFGPSASRPVIRGLGGDRVQVLQDGLAALDVSSLSQDHAVTLESVVSQQIEIIKGPAALLYGSGAAGGLVNVVSSRVPTEVPAKVLTGAAEVRTDTASEERTGALSLDGGAGNFAFHADYFDRDTDDVEIPGFTQSDALRRQLTAAGEEPDDVRGHIPNTAGKASGGAIGGSYIGQNALGGLSYSRYETTYGIPGEDQAFIDMKQDRVDGKAELDLDGAIDKLRLTGAYNDYTHTEFEAPGEPGTMFNQDAYELRFTADHELGAGWRGSAGLQYVDVDFQAIGAEAFVPSSTTQSLSVFAFEEKHFDAWMIELGARAERQKIDVAAELPDYDETAVSLSAGTVWQFADEHAIALNVTRTQRNPQAAELYADGPHVAAQRYEIGDANLDQETSFTADVSLRHTGGGITWTLSAYYNDYTDYIYASPTGDLEDGLPVYVYLQNGARFHGFEAELNVPLIDDGGRHLGLRLASDYVRGKLDNGESLPQIPPLRFGAGLHYDQDRWHIGAQAFYYDRQDKLAQNELPTGSFTLAEVDASYRVPVGSASVFLFLKGTNLLDEDARQHASPLKDIAPLPGRSWHLGARAEF